MPPMADAFCEHPILELSKALNRYHTTHTFREVTEFVVHAYTKPARPFQAADKD